MFHQCSVRIEDVWKQKTLQVLDLQGLILKGARWDSNPRHSEPQSYHCTLGNPFIYAESQRFRFYFCADFAPNFDNYCFNSLNLSSIFPFISFAKNSFVACSFSSIVSTRSICSWDLAIWSTSLSIVTEFVQI